MTRRMFPLLVATLALTACGAGDRASVDFNDADVMFAQMMIPHHEQAIEMSDIALDPSVGARSEVTDLATSIKAAQDPEIAQMEELLTAWGESKTPDDGVDHGSMMGGMLSPEELDSLGLLRGSEFDSRWAEAMIAHHEGAIDMAGDVLDDGKNKAIRALAEAIVATQAAEIGTLKALIGS